MDDLLTCRVYPFLKQWVTSPPPLCFLGDLPPPLCFLGDLPLPCVFWMTHWPAGCICSWSSEWPPLPWNDDTTSSAYGHCVGCYRSRWTSGNSSQATTQTSQVQTPQEPIQIIDVFISALSSRSVSCTTHPVDNSHTKNTSLSSIHETLHYLIIPYIHRKLHSDMYEWNFYHIKPRVQTMFCLFGLNVISFIQ